MKKILIAGIMFAALPFAALAQTATTTVEATTTATTSQTVVEAGLVPGDFFYFLDRWTEALNLAFTFNNENKARKHLEYAKERVSEIKNVLKKPNAKLDDVKPAKENFDVQIADAASIVKGEKERGNNVADLARELDDELDFSHGDLKDALRQHKENNGQAETVIRAKIDALIASGTASTTNANQLKGLTQALESITKEKMDVDTEENDIDETASSTQATFEEVMGKELSAQKHLEQALRLRDDMRQGLPVNFATSSDKFMRDAEAAMKRGDFESAKKMSKEAEQALERAQEMHVDVRMGMPIRPSEDGMMNDTEVERSSDEVKVQNW